jgi:hypothetical protein
VPQLDLEAAAESTYTLGEEAPKASVGVKLGLGKGASVKAALSDDLKVKAVGVYKTPVLGTWSLGLLLAPRAKAPGDQVKVGLKVSFD